MKKTLRSIITAGMCTVILASCGTQGAGPSVQIDANSAAPITLSMFAPVGQELATSESFRDLALEYNALQSRAQVTFDGVSTADGYDGFLEERLDAGNRVDVFVVNAENVKQIAQKGQFHDLSGLDSFQKLTESAKEQATVGEIAYTIPLKMAVYVMGVNVSLLERHGLETPRNREEFLRCCEALKGQGVTPIALNRWFAMTAPVMAASLAPIYQAENRDGLIAGLNSGEVKIGDYMIEGFRLFDTFLAQGYYGDGLAAQEVDKLKANTQDKDDFVNGRVAFRFFAVEELQATQMENGDTCIFTGIPLLPDGVVTLPSISVRLCINANSDHLEEAVAFVDYTTSQRVRIIEQGPPDALSPFHAAAKAEPRAVWKQEILDLMESGHQVPIEDMNVHFGYWDNTRALCLAMIDGMTPEEAAAEFNRRQLEEIGQRAGNA